MIEPKLYWYDFMCRMMVSVFVMASIIGGCSAMNESVGLYDDNPIEEFIESQIEERTGVAIDLSGESPE